MIKTQPNVIKFPNSPNTPAQVLEEITEVIGGIDKLVVFYLDKEGHYGLLYSDMTFPEMCMAKELWAHILHESIDD